MALVGARLNQDVPGNFRKYAIEPGGNQHRTNSFVSSAWFLTESPFYSGFVSIQLIIKTLLFDEDLIARRYIEQDLLYEEKIMTTYFVTRHPGAVEWAATQGIERAIMCPHFDPSVVKDGDLVIGVLPVHLIAEVCERGGRYLHLVMDLPAEARGKELTVQDMVDFGARLEGFMLRRV